MSIHSINSVKMPAGRYFIGDLCYVMNNVWEEFCQKTITDHACADGLVVLSNSVKVAQFCTLYGDGLYKDQLGNNYPVDAGLIGCVRVHDISDEKAWLDGGNLFDFTDEFDCHEENGIIQFGHITINTGDEDEEHYND